MKRVWYNMISLMLCSTLAGCGFVNVAHLRPAVPKISITVAGTSAFLADPLVQEALATTPSGVSVQPNFTDATPASVMQSVYAKKPSDAILVGMPATLSQEVASQIGASHVFTLSTSTPIGAGASFAGVSLVPVPTLAVGSLAGYLAGSIQPSGVIDVYEATQSSGLLEAIASGLNVSHAKSILVDMGRYTGKPGALRAGQVVIVFSPMSQQEIDSIAQTGAILIDMTGQIDPNAALRILRGAVLARGIHTVYQYIERKQGASGTLSIPVSLSDLRIQRAGRYGYAAVSRYRLLLERGVLKPTEYALSPPTDTVLASYGLPVIGTKPHSGKMAKKKA
ncbi:hypothetical protein [Ferroacidibacillus organovorans]|uniref:ABC transporter substrate-binding protein n=1 Tax=Ferroacidibacillus organovorans TaxID=1765683 RepID=A0A101XT71_9BACL|nr:hypothetical protein [Ferroacidibacillus organovorans]KUO97001.1 hypothetical protein ATW55_07180 [Ferroacidibacillus organovorans]